MTAEKHPLKLVREALGNVLREVFGYVGDEPYIYADYDKTQALSRQVSQALTTLTIYMSHPQSCAECERLGRENARLREAVGPIQGITLGPKLEGLITEQEAVELVNMVINTQLEISAVTIAAAGGES